MFEETVVAIVWLTTPAIDAVGISKVYAVFLNATKTRGGLFPLAPARPTPRSRCLRGGGEALYMPGPGGQALTRVVKHVT